MKNRVFGNESPIDVSASAEPVYAFEFVGATTVTTPTAKIYINGGDSDMTATNMPTGSASASGNVVVTPIIKNLKGGNFYVVEVTATVDGVKEARKLELRVQKPSSRN
jgi:hypothetical protein